MDLESDKQAPQTGVDEQGTGGEKLRSKFNLFSFLKSNIMQPVSIAAAAVLGATTIGDPLLSTTALAGGAMLGSFYLLSKTSDIVVDNAQALGNKLGISSLALGTILGAVTSMPELFVSLGSIASGTPEIGVGNIVGSNIANILLILGATALISPIRSEGTSWKFNTAVMGGATALFGAQMATGMLSPLAGGAMIGGLGAYMAGSYMFMKKDQKATEEAEKNGQKREVTPPAPLQMPGWAKSAWQKSGLQAASNGVKSLFNGKSGAQPKAEVTKPENPHTAENAPKWFNAAMAAAGIGG